MTFWGAVMFQWVNVKGWVMVIGYHHRLCRDCRLSLEYRDPDRGHAVARGAVVAWPGRCSAAALRPLLTLAAAVRAFNIVMAMLLLASLYPGLHGRMMPHCAMREQGFP